MNRELQVRTNKRNNKTERTVEQWHAQKDIGDGKKHDKDWTSGRQNGQGSLPSMPVLSCYCHKRDQPRRRGLRSAFCEGLSRFQHIFLQTGAWQGGISRCWQKYGRVSRRWHGQNLDGIAEPRFRFSEWTALRESKEGERGAKPHRNTLPADKLTRSERTKTSIRTQPSPIYGARRPDVGQA